MKLLSHAKHEIKTYDKSTTVTMIKAQFRKLKNNSILLLFVFFMITLERCHSRLYWKITRSIYSMSIYFENEFNLYSNISTQCSLFYDKKTVIVYSIMDTTFHSIRDLLEITLNVTVIVPRSRFKYFTSETQRIPYITTHFKFNYKV